MLGGLALARVTPASFGGAPRGPLLIAVAGVLVGFGTGLGEGCTSGHGVAGLGRLSSRSLVATLTFIGSGVLTTYLALHGAGAP